MDCLHYQSSLKTFWPKFLSQENFDSVNGAYDTQFDLKFFDGEISIVIQRPAQGLGSAANQVYIVAPPIFVCPVFSCINETMVLAFHCFDYDVTFLSTVNLEDTASDTHKTKRERCLKKVAKTSNTYPYTKWVIFRNAIFCIIPNSMFSPKNLANAPSCLASAQTGFHICVTWAL